RRHPGASRVIGLIAVVILLVGLVLMVPQAAELLTSIDAVAERVGSFTSPIQLPSWLNTSLLVAGALAATERALTLRNHRLIDADSPWTSFPCAAPTGAARIAGPRAGCYGRRSEASMSQDQPCALSSAGSAGSTGARKCTAVASTITSTSIMPVAAAPGSSTRDTAMPSPTAVGTAATGESVGSAPTTTPTTMVTTTRSSCSVPSS